MGIVLISKRKDLSVNVGNSTIEFVGCGVMPATFEWDENKATSNLAKHGVSFEEASSVFNDPLARVFDDEEHSGDETREIAIGYSERSRILFVSYTERGRHRFRIISARKATRRERINHEERIDV